MIDFSMIDFLRTIFCTGETYRKLLQEELSALNSAELIKIMRVLETYVVQNGLF